MHVSVGAIAAQGVSPIVRIPAPENWLVKRALDTGGGYYLISSPLASLTAAFPQHMACYAL